MSKWRIRLLLAGVVWLMLFVPAAAASPDDRAANVAMEIGLELFQEASDEWVSGLVSLGEAHDSLQAENCADRKDDAWCAPQLNALTARYEELVDDTLNRLDAAQNSLLECSMILQTSLIREMKLRLAGGDLDGLLAEIGFKGGRRYRSQRLRVSHLAGSLSMGSPNAHGGDEGTPPGSRGDASPFLQPGGGDEPRPWTEVEDYVPLRLRITQYESCNDAIDVVARARSLFEPEPGCKAVIQCGTGDPPGVGECGATND